MAVMRIKLIQDGIVDSADAVQRIDFTGLRAGRDWSVSVNFGDGDFTVAKVDWSGAASYEVRTSCIGCDTKIIYAVLHRNIVPVVLVRLLQLFVSERLHYRNRHQPIVIVTPINH